MRKRILLVLFALSIVAAGCGLRNTSLPEPKPQEITPTVFLTATATKMLTSTPKPSPTPTWTPSPTPTATPSPTPSPTPVPTATSTPTRALSRPTPSLKLVYWGNGKKKQVHIGFDVEGNPKILYQILDILKEYHYHTTFFIQGAWARQHPAAVKRIVQEGHEIGNHSWSHPDFRELTRQQMIKELTDTENLCVKLTGKSTKPYFRPPYSYRNRRSIEVAYELGYTHILWSIDSYDWRDRNADKVYHNIVDHVRPGAIIYLHTSHRTDPVALRRALKTLTQEGYRLVSLTEILQK